MLQAGGGLIGAGVDNVVANINAYLATNPYSDQLKFKSVTQHHFFKDKDGKTANKYQKPIGLYYRLLKMFAMPSSVIIDATCGSGSLELAAMECDAPNELEFVAFDINAYQITNCVARLERSSIKPTSKHDVMLDATAEVHGSDLTPPVKN